MTLYPKEIHNGSEREGAKFARDQKNPCLAPAKIDEILLEALDALEQTRKLHETTPNPETKRQAKRILTSLHSSLIQLAPLGVHSLSRLERVSAAP